MSREPHQYTYFVHAEQGAGVAERSPRRVSAAEVEVLARRVPHPRAANSPATQLPCRTGADRTGLVLGARVPIVLPRRADSMRTGLAFVAETALADARRTAPAGAPN
jgi:hypothetical protein